ncbi:MAG: hypothetical protein KDJ54_00760 [Candidatus Competibacteraceae bacterium]|nr:hypothetical protein [Candidatus Competibacteraceae bacterium]
MQVLRIQVIRLIVAFAATASLLATLPASAVSRCGTFEIVPIPGMTSHLAAFDDGTVWAIGGSASAPTVPVLRHFDGSAWSEQPLPAEADGFAFSASGSTPDGDAWFAATRAYSVYEIRVLFMRVRGGNVDRVDTFLYPSSINTPGAPVDISASSADDVWALTASGDVIHFDGASWQAMDVPPIYTPDQRLYPKAIYAAAPDDVWTVGYGGSGRATYIGYTQHWNGSSWTKVSTPFDGQDQTFFLDIDGSGSNDIWVAGHSNYSQDILLHWDSSEWIQAQGPASGAAMAKVMTMGPGNAWAVPYSLSAGDAFYYWNGAAWSEGARFNLPDAVTISWHDVAKAGTCDAWAVGAYYDGTAYQPLAARLMPGDVQAQAEVLVGAIDVTRARASGKSYYGEAVVTILDGDLTPVSGAIVSGDFSGPSSESLVATTGADGRAVFSSAVVRRPSGNWCFTVAGVSASGAIYNEALNMESSDCEAGGGGNRR